MGQKDHRLGQIVYILEFYNISFSWLLPLDGFQFNFLFRVSENDLYTKEWYYVAPPPDFHLHDCSFLMLYCNVFVGCVWSITLKLRSEAKPTISEQPDCASSFNSPCHRHFRRFLVESWPVRTKLRTQATSLSFPPRPLLSSCFGDVI